MTGSPPRLDIIVAVADNGVIGRDGDMPWRLPSDLRHFKAITIGKPVVMGRRTFAAIGRPLPGRVNLVVSRDSDFSAAGVEVFSDLDAALTAARLAAAKAGLDAYIVAGGGTIYAATIGRAERIHLTRVHARPEGDTRFPVIDPSLWRLAGSRPMERGERDSAEATFETWERIGQE